MDGTNPSGLAEALAMQGGRAFRIRHSNPEDHIFRIIKNTGKFYETELLNALERLIKPGDLVFDVGANIGNHAIFFAGVCGARVVAFEPNPETVALLVTNAGVNDLSESILVQQVALGAESSQGAIDGSTVQHNLGAARVVGDPSGSIIIRKLDDVAPPERPVLIKIDVEGMDFEVLRGAERILREYTPYVSIEAANRDAFNAISDFLEPLGYAHFETHNYTPTHLFAPLTGQGGKALSKRVSREIGLQYIDISSVRSKVDSQVGALNKKIAAIETKQTAVSSDVSIALGEARGAPAKASAEATAALAGLVLTLQREMGDMRTVLQETQTTLAAMAKEARLRDAALVGSVHADLEAAAAAQKELSGRFEGEVALLRAHVDTQHAMHESLSAGLAAKLDDISARQTALHNEALNGLDARLGEFSSRLDEDRRAFAQILSETHASLADHDRTLSEGQEKLTSSLDLALERFERSAIAMVEANVAMGAWFEGELRGLRRDLKAEVQTSITNVAKRELAAAIEAQARMRAESSGAQAAEFIVELDRRAPPLQQSAPPPRRAFFAPEASLETLPDEQINLLVQRKPANGAQQSAHWLEPSRIEAVPASNDILLEADLAAVWEKAGAPQGGARLEAGGVVVLDGGDEGAGVAASPVDLPGGGLIEISIELKTEHGAGDLMMRVRSEADERLGPDQPLTKGVNKIRVFAPARTQQVKVYVLSRRKGGPGRFALGRLRVERLDEDAHQTTVRANVGQPVIASMATIPSRRAMLMDCVRSLLAQCDQVRVFLNNYPDVPDFLNHPRVEVRRSQDWDDRGDAGKMFWLDRDQEHGYRLIVDDDLIFPPDFAEVMCGKVAAHGDRAIFAMHGVLLRQPVAQYYDSKCRAATFHFERGLGEDRAVHIAATNALCLHTSAVKMRWSDFLYCNSADIWLALYAQKNDIPLVTPARLQHWVRENRHEAPQETIYAHSRKRTRSRMDSSQVQDAALRFAAPLSLKPSSRPKYAIGILAQSADGLRASLTSWLAVRPLNVDWVVIVAIDPANLELSTAMQEVKVEHETHVVTNGSARAVFDLAQSLQVEAALIVPDTVTYSDRCDLAAAMSVAPLGVVQAADNVIGYLWRGSSPWRLESLQRSEARLGDALVAADLSAPAVAGALTDLERAPESVGSATRRTRTIIAPGKRINDVFERVVVLNLDRQLERWEQAKSQLRRAEITAERFSAVDGSAPDVAAEYEAYAAGKVVEVSADLPQIRSSEDFYMRFPSQQARIAHLEQTTRTKAIGSLGAWGYLRSYERILEQALADQVESLLVLHDDVLVHKDAVGIFAQAYAEAPTDWLILQLGALQYNWSPPWVDWRSPHLYRTNGAAVGSHAVGMRFEILPFLLDHVKRMDLPFDVGALSGATHAFARRCFVAYPNIAIPRLASVGSDMSAGQQERAMDGITHAYRWSPDDYWRDEGKL